MLIGGSAGRRACAAGAIIFGYPLFLPVAALADPVGGGGEDTGHIPDDPFQTYCFDGAFPATLQDNVHWTNDTTENHSNFNATFNATCDVTGTGRTDVIWFEANLPGTRGNYHCDFVETDDTCRSAFATLNEAEITAGLTGNLAEHNITKTACHENGHAIGLTHYKDGNGTFPAAPNGESDCMISGEVNDSGAWTVYAAHHKDHINNDSTF